MNAVPLHSQMPGGVNQWLEPSILYWLLEGDVSVQYQMRRDLLQQRHPELQARIASEGWGAAFLAALNADGHWGRGFYQPKWISTHYTLLDLRYLELSRDHPVPRESVCLILSERKGMDGAINPAGTINESDVCVNGMFLTYACYFGAPEADLESVVDFIISQHMADGGPSRWNTLRVLRVLNAYGAHI